ncbi:hypothetical protein AKJ16_DCAP23037 [Drosera capensis]
MATPASTRLSCIAQFPHTASSSLSNPLLFLSGSTLSPLSNHHSFLASKTLSVSALNTSRPGSLQTDCNWMSGVCLKTSIGMFLQGLRLGEAVEDEVLEAFFRDRKLNGDFITKATDLIFLKASDIILEEDSRKDDTLQAAASLPAVEGVLDEPDDGFLKLSRTHEWVLGDGAVPLNKKLYIKKLEDDSKRRKKLDLLNYEALKRELLLLTISIGTAGTGYCLITLSIQAAESYAIGVAFSCLYLQLLCKHVDNLSRDSIPQIFTPKKSGKKMLTGITSDDVKDTLEKWVKGSGLALSSPRLVIPASIFGSWILSHQYLASEFFDFQITPAILGMFAYKGAALAQIYRDNEDLKFDFPENDLDRSDY